MRLIEQQADGSTLRDHLLAAAQNGAQRDALLDATAPRGTEALWECYASLSASRTPESGIAPSQIAAWQALHGVTLNPWEVDTLEAVDRACMSIMRDQAARRRKART